MQETLLRAWRALGRLRGAQLAAGLAVPDRDERRADLHRAARPPWLPLDGDPRTRWRRSASRAEAGSSRSPTTRSGPRRRRSSARASSSRSSSRCSTSRRTSARRCCCATCSGCRRAEVAEAMQTSRGRGRTARCSTRARASRRGCRPRTSRPRCAALGDERICALVARYTRRSSGRRRRDGRAARARTHVDPCRPGRRRLLAAWRPCGCSSPQADDPRVAAPPGARQRAGRGGLLHARDDGVFRAYVLDVLEPAG